MISTVTTATIYTVTTASLAASIALVGILFLFALLVQKEIASSSSSQFMQRLSQYLNIGIFPLLITFILIAGIKVFEVLH
jgi:hypothetical protein